MDDEIEVSVSLPLDSDGFVRRECPHCSRQFKWHHGPANEEAEQHADPPAYYCPFCGRPAGHDSWFTQEQLDYMEQAVAPEVSDRMTDEINKLFKGMKGVTLDRPRSAVHPRHPDPLTEPDDMTIVASPCHSYEPVKIPDEHAAPLHCFVCGAAFAV